MFTGIIEATGAIRGRSDARLTIERPAIFDDVRRGSSICVSGACLTMVDVGESTMHFDVVDETWKKTTLGSLTIGDRVNLERALPASGRFEGHIVQGHVEGVGRVRCCSFLVAGSTSDVLEVEFPEVVLPFIVSKGSIAIDGVSLTVAALEGNRCFVALIPHTLENTTLGALQSGSRVNIETDILLRGLLQSRAAGISRA